MNEIISGMRLIKMYAWEWAFHEYVKNIRKLGHFPCVGNLTMLPYIRKESRLITQASMIRACNLVFFYIGLPFLNFVTFSTYAGSGNELTARKVFTVISLFSFVRLYFINLFVYFMLTTSEVMVALKRIQVN